VKLNKSKGRCLGLEQLPAVEFRVTTAAFVNTDFVLTSLIVSQRKSHFYNTVHLEIYCFIKVK